MTPIENLVNNDHLTMGELPVDIGIPEPLLRYAELLKLKGALTKTILDIENSSQGTDTLSSQLIKNPFADIQDDTQSVATDTPQLSILRERLSEVTTAIENIGDTTKEQGGQRWWDLISSLRAYTAIENGLKPKPALSTLTQFKIDVDHSITNLYNTNAGTDTINGNIKDLQDSGSLEEEITKNPNGVISILSVLFTRRDVLEQDIKDVKVIEDQAKYTWAKLWHSTVIARK